MVQIARKLRHWMRKMQGSLVNDFQRVPIGNCLRKWPPNITLCDVAFAGCLHLKASARAVNPPFGGEASLRVVISVVLRGCNSLFRGEGWLHPLF
jgi:hypothetical protein